MALLSPRLMLLTYCDCECDDLFLYLLSILSTICRVIITLLSIAVLLSPLLFILYIIGPVRNDPVLQRVIGAADL